MADVGESFAFETTCAGLSHARFLRSCRDRGYEVTLIFLWLPSPQAAIERVAKRVAQGGHGIDDKVVVRRFWAGLRNLRRLYLRLADTARIYDNSGDQVMIAESLGGRFIVHDERRWRQIEEGSR